MLVQVIKKRESVLYQGEIFKKGDTLNMADSVAESLIKRGYVQQVQDAEIKDENEPAVDENQVAGHLDPEQLREMSYQELRKLAKDMELDTTGTKEELVERIAATTVYADKADIVDDEEVEDEEPDELPDTSMPE